MDLCGSVRAEFVAGGNGWRPKTQNMLLGPVDLRPRVPTHLPTHLPDRSDVPQEKLRVR